MTLHPLAYLREAERCEKLARLVLADAPSAQTRDEARRLRRIAREYRERYEGVEG